MEFPNSTKTEREIQEEEYVRELAETLKKKIREGGGSFSETISIRSDGKLEVMEKNQQLKSLFAHEGQSGPEDLYRLAFRVQQETPELTFSFQRDPEGKSITYTTSEIRASNSSSS